MARRDGAGRALPKDGVAAQWARQGERSAGPLAMLQWAAGQALEKAAWERVVLRQSALCVQAKPAAGGGQTKSDRAAAKSTGSALTAAVLAVAAKMAAWGAIL